MRPIEAPRGAGNLDALEGRTDDYVGRVECGSHSPIAKRRQLNRRVRYRVQHHVVASAEIREGGRTHSEESRSAGGAELVIGCVRWDTHSRLRTKGITEPTGPCTLVATSTERLNE